MNKQHDGMMGNLPLNINKEISTPKNDACSITKLVKHSGDVVGYELSNGNIVSKEEGVALAKQGGIAGVAVAVNQGNEYLRSLPDQEEGNNLSSLPVIHQ